MWELSFRVLLSPSLAWLWLASLQVEKQMHLFKLSPSSVVFSYSVMSDSFQPHGLQHIRLPCPSPSPGVCSNSSPLSRWCHPTILSSVPLPTTSSVHHGISLRMRTSMMRMTWTIPSCPGIEGLLSVGLWRIHFAFPSWLHVHNFSPMICT